jgi:poly(hydroxyalkanoate) depolymerase family esterase
LKILEALRARAWRKFGSDLQHVSDDSHGPIEGMPDIAATIENALAAAGLMPHAGESARTDATPQWSDIEARPPLRAPLPGRGKADPKLPGEFVTRTFSNPAGTRVYKLYVPSSIGGDSGQARALVVMLHGCTQSPDDFAAGTRMNELAEKEGFLVAYPVQAVNANGSKCWNWFRAEDQQRERGEPSLIAGMTREIAAQFGVEDHRIFVAGLSAGAAMAVILGTTYPDLFAAVGAHSGLPYGAAHDAPSAFQAMKGADARGGFLKDGRSSGDAIPTIVFHGDRDTTVNRSNSDAIVERATSASAAAGRASITQRGRAAGGQEYTRTTYSSAAGRPIVEAWIVHGAAHAWSGGSPNGSFTESRGPDASSEMLRFFFAQDR